MGEWKYKKLGEYVKVNGGNAFKSNEYQEVGTPLLRISNIKDHLIDLTDCIYVSDDFIDTHKQYLLDEGNIVIAMSGATTGKTGVVRKENLPLLLNQRVGAFNIKEKTSIYESFLQYVVESFYFQSILQIDAIGGAQPNISPKQIESINIYVPPIQEQQKIAAILSSVDEAIEKTEQVIEQTERVKKGLMQELLTKGIGHTEFKDSPVGKVPQGWEIAIFKDVFDRITTKNSVDNQNVLTISGEHGLISQLEYFNKSVSSKSLTNYIYLENGDFAYNKSYSNGYPLGAIKRLERYEAGVVSTLYICFRLKDPNINGFYKYYFDSPYWHRQVYSIAPEGGRSHGLLNVGVKDFFEILISVPPVEEQMMIEQKLASIDEKIMIEKDKLNNLQTLKQGLMQELLTGKKRVKVEASEEVLS